MYSYRGKHAGMAACSSNATVRNASHSHQSDVSSLLQVGNQAQSPHCSIHERPDAAVFFRLDLARRGVQGLRRKRPRLRLRDPTVPACALHHRDEQPSPPAMIRREPRMLHPVTPRSASAKALRPRLARLRDAAPPTARLRSREQRNDRSTVGDKVVIYRQLKGF